MFYVTHIISREQCLCFLASFVTKRFLLLSVYLLGFRCAEHWLLYDWTLCFLCQNHRLLSMSAATVMWCSCDAVCVSATPRMLRFRSAPPTVRWSAAGYVRGAWSAGVLHYRTSREPKVSWQLELHDVNRYGGRQTVSLLANMLLFYVLALKFLSCWNIRPCFDIYKNWVN